MQLTDQDIAEFQELYQRHYGTELSKEEAHDKGFRLIRLIELTAKHETQQQIEQEQ